MASKKTQKLFKKAYYYNWDDGILGLQKIVDDKNCDRATALMIYWHGRPAGSHSAQIRGFLEGLEAKLIAEHFPTTISYAVESEFFPDQPDTMDPRLLEPVIGDIDFSAVLWPNLNPFQEQILVLCKHCEDASLLADLAALGADFSKKILNGYAYPIIVAINHGQVAVVKYLVSQGVDLNKKVDKAPLLAYAVGSRSPAMVAWMIANGANVNAKGPYGRTALHGIAGVGDSSFDDVLRDIAEQLIAAGADPNALDSDKQTPRTLAAMWSNTEYGEFLDGLR